MPPGDDEVILHVEDLDARVGRAAQDLALLSGEEQARAARFKVEDPRRRFVAARAFLRETVGRAVGLDPARVELGTAARGKPFLANAPAGTEVSFNLSHSRGLAVLAMTRTRVVGVDLEHLRHDVDVDGLSRRFFAPREREAILALPERERGAAFFACWTRKEAYLKALGDGLGIPLDRFEVSCVPGAPPALLVDHAEPGAAGAWEMRSFNLVPGTAAALVVARRPGNAPLEVTVSYWSQPSRP